ncbi:MAG: hypothetical protein JWQ98_1300 [Chlorobi bacterium]|nr:hypothetical protein [Chlorobiota bacterium]
MEFEQLLRKYLDGSMSEGELDTFRALLDRVPEYRMELRQTLEIRSLLHDDALNLKAPADLSEHIRIAVGSSFAADAIVDQQRDHRKPFWPFAARISAGVFVAACLVVGVAFTPTLPPLARRILRGESAGSQVTESGRASADRTPAASAGPDRHFVAVSRSIAHADIASALPERASRFVDNLQMLGHEFPSRNIVPAGGSDASSQNVAENNAGRSPSVTRVPESLLARDHANLFGRNTQGSAYAASPDPSFRSPIVPLEGSLPQAVTGNDGRSLTFGITLGSGQVTETKSPTALLQNSYYFSFAVSGSDRVGVEMGASSFQQVKTITPGNSPSTGFAKGTAGAISDDASNVGAGNRSLTQPRSLEQRSQQPITYGAVFYDRRLKLNHSWDVCGRVTVGAADDAMIGNVRAYAAYTIPTTKSVSFTFTMGVGGGTLYSLTPHKASTSTSGNYGIFYGIETGF